MFLNQYSFLILAVLLSVAAGSFLLRNNPTWRDILAFGVIIAALVASWVVLHPVQTPLMEDAKKVQSLIGAGTPVLLEFQSPYCVLCAQIKPAVDELERELENQAGAGRQIHIIRLNVQEAAGRELAPVYGFEFTPTFIYFDAQGNEVWRTIGSFDPRRVRDSLK